MRQRGMLQLDHNTWRLQLRRTDEAGKVRRTWARIGSKAELPTRAAARRAADRYLERINPREVHAGTPMEWDAWCDRYIDRWLAMHAKGTRSTQASIIDTHLRPAFKGPVYGIQLQAIQDWIVEQRRAGVASSTIASRFAVLRRMLRQAADEGLAVTPPTLAQVTLPKDEEVHSTVRSKAFTEAECKAIFEQASILDCAAFALARYAGLRGSELLGLTWALIDTKTWTITVRQQALDGEVRPLKTKGSAAVLQAPPELVRYLNELAMCTPTLYDGFLFKGPTGRPETSQELRERLHAYLDQLGLRRRGLHAFRHACALSMADQGVNPEVIRRAMRHSSLRVTAIYLSAAPEDIAAGLARGARRPS